MYAIRFGKINTLNYKLQQRKIFTKITCQSSNSSTVKKNSSKQQQTKSNKQKLQQQQQQQQQYQPIQSRFSSQFAQYMTQGQDTVGNIIRDMKCLKLDLDYWGQRFEMVNSRKPTEQDMKSESPWMLERYKKFQELQDFLSDRLKSKTKDLGDWYIKELNSMGMEFKNGQVVIIQSGWVDSYLKDTSKESQYDKYLEKGNQENSLDIVTALNINPPGPRLGSQNAPKPQKKSTPQKDIIM